MSPNALSEGLAHLVSLLYVTDLLSRAGVDGGEGLPAHRVMPLVVDEDLGVLDLWRTFETRFLGRWLTHDRFVDKE